jgi:hypothetical protein
LFILDSTPNNKNKYNWVSQVKNIFVSLDFFNLWLRQNPNEIEKELPSILKKYDNKLLQEDNTKFLNSYYFTQLSLEKPLVAFKITFKILRLLFQLRTINRYTIKLTLEKSTYIINPINICTLCNNESNENLLHILCYCPVYKPIRDHFKFQYNTNPEHINQEIIIKLIRNPQPKELFKLYKYLNEALLLRFSLI